MPLSTIRNWNEAATYLTELRDTVRGDVRPLLATGGRAPFAICREVFSYVDHLGHLYTGSTRVGNRFTTFLREVMFHQDDGYRDRAEEIYQMFRNGPVHEFRPKTLENRQGQRLTWAVHDGTRDEAEWGRHLRPRPRGGPDYSLPVSTPCLLDDLEAAILDFATLGPANERLTLWNRAANDLLRDVPCDFQI